MRTQTTTDLSDGPEWVAQPVDPTGWLIAPKANGAGAPGIPATRERWQRAFRRAEDREATRGREPSGRRAARVRRRSGPHARTLSPEAGQDEGLDPASTEVTAVDGAKEGYRLGRWARLALTVIVLTAAVVVVLTATAGSPPPASVDVTVGPGDTLWSIATDAAPDRDPRAVIEELKQLNNLPDQVLAIGVVLRVPAATD